MRMPDMVENSMSSRSSLLAYASSHRSRADFFSVSKVVLLLYSGSPCFVSVTLIINERREPGQAIGSPPEEPRRPRGGSTDRGPAHDAPIRFRPKARTRPLGPGHP